MKELKKNFKRKVLSNGMTIVFEKRDIPVVSVAFAVRNGGINENLDEKGISHFIEHLLYKGTPNRNHQQIAEEIEKTGGELNGFTDESITAYWCKMPSKFYGVALDVLSDMIKNPLFDEKELKKERKVIFEEIKMRRDSPVTCVMDQIQSCLYGPPFGVPLIGDEKTLTSLDREKIIKKFREIYTPNNMILCVVGDANFSEIVRFAEKNFGNEKGKVPHFKLQLKNKTIVEKRKGVDQANLIFAYHVPIAKDKKSYAAEVLSVLMGGGMSSRLFNEIREKRNLAYGVKAVSNIEKDFAYNLVYVGTTKENFQKVRKLIVEEFEKVGEGLTEKELQEIKDQMIGNFEISMEDSQTQMANLLVAEVEGKAEEFYNFEKNISEVKLKDVKELARQASKKYSFFALVPQ